VASFYSDGPLKENQKFPGYYERPQAAMPSKSGPNYLLKERESGTFTVIQLNCTSDIIDSKPLYLMYIGR
jgi:hypothetical protein